MSKAAGLTHVRIEGRNYDKKPLQFSIIRRLFSYTKPYSRKRNLLFALVIIRSIQLPSLAWAIAAVIGGPLSRLEYRGVLMGAGGYLLLAMVTQFIYRYRSRLALELGELAINDLRHELFTHLQRMPMSFFQKTQRGRLISRFASDIESVRRGVQDVFFISLVQGGQMTCAGIFMAIRDWQLFLVVLGIAPVIWAINTHFHHKLSTAHRRVRESFSRVTATVAESVTGIRVTQGFVRQRINAGLFNELVADHSQVNYVAARTAGIFMPLLEFNSQLFIALVLLIGGWRAFHGLTEVENLFHFFLLSNLFFGPIRMIANQYNMALTAMAGAERVFRLLDTEPEWADPPDAIVLNPMHGYVRFRDVCFSYVPGRPVLNDISLTAEPGRTVALVGHTGSGKSTIINLLAKFYLPASGTITIDGKNILHLNSDSIHRNMGIVLQQNFLFTGTVMDNIRMSRPDATDADVIDAAEKLDCRDLIEQLPEGFNTGVTESGGGISLGQRQLICFTRAMLADPRILILDEATSAVDTMTEVRIQKALARLLHERTNVVVAHRLSTIRHADTVLVLDNGEIIERGSHEELVEHGGHYAELHDQFIRSSQ